MRTPGTAEIEMRLLVEAIYQRYGHDFRDYSLASLKRRMLYAQRQMGARTLSALQERILHDAASFAELLQYLTVPVSEMFRDPAYFEALRRHVMPVLQTYASIKIWIAGCSTGEELYSFAILLKEEGLLARTILYATDINPQSLQAAEAGVYDLDHMAGFTDNHQQSGASTSLSDYYTAAYNRAIRIARSPGSAIPPVPR